MKRTVLTLVIAVLMIVGSAGIAAASDAKWIVRGEHVQTWPSSDTSQTEDLLEGLPPIFSELSVDNGQGFGLDIEYKVNPKFGVVLMSIFTDVDATLGSATLGQPSALVKDNNTVDFYTIDGGFNYHFTPDKRVDLYLGAFAGMVFYDAVTFSVPALNQEVDIDFDSQFSYGVAGGIDIPLKADGGFIFTAGVKYLISDLQQKGGGHSIAIDPIIGSIGIGYRF